MSEIRQRTVLVGDDVWEEWTKRAKEGGGKNAVLEELFFRRAGESVFASEGGEWAGLQGLPQGESKAPEQGDGEEFEERVKVVPLEEVDGY